MKRNGYTDILKVPGITYTRTGKATAWRLDGTLAEFEPNVPRITDAGITIEGQRTNLLLHSADPSQSNWNAVSATKTPNFGPTPIAGKLSAKITPATTSGRAQLSTGAAAAGSVLTATILVKNIDAVASSLTLYDGASIFLARLTLNWTGATLSGLTAGNPAPISSGFRARSDGWYEVWASFTAAAGSNAVLIYPDSKTGTKAVEVGFAQLEQASTPSTPIITTGAAATRGADNLYLGGLTSTFAAPFSVVLDVADVPAQVGKFPAILTVSSGSAANWICIFRSPYGTIDMTVRSGNTQTGNGGRASSGSAPIKLALTFNGTTIKWAVNGVLAASVTPTAAPIGLNRIDPLGGPSGEPSGSAGRKTIILPYALTDAELINLTK